MEGMPYLSSVAREAPDVDFVNIAANYSERDEWKTTAFYVNSDTAGRTFHKATDIIEQADRDGHRHGPTVCMVENISPAFIEELGSKWELEPKFFAQHASNPEHHWMKLWGPQIYKIGRVEYPGQPEPRPDVAQRKPSIPKPYDFIDGNFEYHEIPEDHGILPSYYPNYFKRYCEWSPWYGTNTLCSNTRISYYRVSGHLYLFLVDAPLSLQNYYKDFPRRIRPTLKLPYAKNWGGLFLPQLLEKDQMNAKGCRRETPYRIFESLSVVFPYRWHREILFHHDPDGGEAFPPGPLCYMLSNSLWQKNLRYLTEGSRDISLTELRDPKLEINYDLHDIREDVVAFLSTRLEETVEYIPDSIREFWEELQERSRISQSNTKDTPLSKIEKTLLKAKELERFLMDTFQLLMSSVNVQDSRRSIKLAALVAILTVMATIFVPLSFLTGFFGMNFKELNGSVMSLWIFWASSGGILVAFAFTPLLIFIVMSNWDSKKRTRAEGKRTNIVEKPNFKRWKNLPSYY